MKRAQAVLIFIVIVGIVIVAWLFLRGEQFVLPKGETTPFKTTEESTETMNSNTNTETININKESFMLTSTRQIFVTDNVKHSVPLDEIFSGTPSKDDIPSIDNPKFVETKEADNFLKDNSVGLGIIHKGEIKFYPYQILVWHEIVNDIVGNDPLLITYCPLCATGIVFERTLEGEPVEFGVSGKLWQSNLLMYNRSSDFKKESLWSQALGEAVLGEFTGMKLAIISSDTVQYGDWKKQYPNTKVLSQETGSARSYGSDPYEGYYTNDFVSFGATFNDDRLHPKAYVLGIEIDGKYKAYYITALHEGINTDAFAEKIITLEKSSIGEVRIFVGENKTPLLYTGGFWFSWLTIHPNTELYK